MNNENPIYFNEDEFFNHVKKMKDDKNKLEICFFLKFVCLFQNKNIMNKFFTSKSMKIMDDIYDMFYTRYIRSEEHEKFITTGVFVEFFINYKNEKETINKYLSSILNKNLNIDLSKDFIFKDMFKIAVRKSIIK